MIKGFQRIPLQSKEEKHEKIFLITCVILDSSIFHDNFLYESIFQYRTRPGNALIGVLVEIKSLALQNKTEKKLGLLWRGPLTDSEEKLSAVKDPKNKKARIGGWRRCMTRYSWKNGNAQKKAGGGQQNYQSSSRGSFREDEVTLLAKAITGEPK